MPSSTMTFPIDGVMSELVAVLKAQRAVVVVAPPGSGKTTRIPPALLKSGLLDGVDGVRRKLLMLQPRRVAARSTATWMARQLGQRVGQAIGYQVRFDRKIGPDTRIEVLTEGLLTRRLQSDPFLEDVQCVILDEFHERSLNGDLALALLQEVRREVRPELLLVVMSATLDAEQVATWLGDAPIVRCEGRTHPVEITYAPNPQHGHSEQYGHSERHGHSERYGRVERQAAAVVRSCAREMRDGARPDGHILVFMPGVGEIQRTIRAIGALPGRDVVPLHGRLGPRQQDAAIAGGGPPRVIVATNIAETSLTIDGVTCVVDSGLARVSVLDTVVGLPRLQTKRISHASADQRAGRAGRTAPGTGVRLWSEFDARVMPRFAPAEITGADLCSTLLTVYAWGSDEAAFQWFERPNTDECSRALGVLLEIGALHRKDDGQLAITTLGKAISNWPVHPRIGRVLWDGMQHSAVRKAAFLAALVEEGSPLVGDAHPVGDDDVEICREALAQADANRRDQSAGVDARKAARLLRTRDALLNAVRRTGSGGGDTSRKGKDSSESTTWAALLVGGFGDRVGQLRPDARGQFRMASGQGAKLSPRSRAEGADWIVAVGMRAADRGKQTEHIIDLACALDPAELPTTRTQRVTFDEALEAVVADELVVYRELVIRSQRVRADPEQATELLTQAALAHPSRAFQIDGPTATLLYRLRLLQRAMPELALPTFSVFSDSANDVEAAAPTDDQAFIEQRAFIEQLCVGCRSFEELRKLDLKGRIRGVLGHSRCKQLDRYAPTTFTLPNGRQTTLKYSDEGPPVLAARIQRLFGLRETPTVASGRVAVQLHLLAPNGRPAQVTSDLASFWMGGYAEVRRQLRGRYPKHAWPETPP